MARTLIVVGDKTTGGGAVINGSPDTDIDGKPVARVGDKATCPKHKGVFPIVSGDETLIFDGRAAARHGDRLACGCQLVAGQQTHAFVEAGVAGGGPAGGGGTPVAASASTLTAASPASVASPASLIGKEAVCEECLLDGAKSAAVFLGR